MKSGQRGKKGPTICSLVICSAVRGERGERGQLFAPFGPFAKKMINFGHFQRYFSNYCVILLSAAKIFAAKGRKWGNFLAHMGPMFRQ